MKHFTDRSLYDIKLFADYLKNLAEMMCKPNPFGFEEKVTSEEFYRKKVL